MALGGTADAVVPLAVVVNGIDAEHQRIHDAKVQDLVCQGRGVGGEPQVADDALGLQVLNVGQDAVFLVGGQVALLTQAVEKAEVDVVRPEVLELPGDGLLDLVLFRGPANSPLV